MAEGGWGPIEFSSGRMGRLNACLNVHRPSIALHHYFSFVDGGALVGDSLISAFVLVYAELKENCIGFSGILIGSPPQIGLPSLTGPVRDASLTLFSFNLSNTHSKSR